MEMNGRKKAEADFEWVKNKNKSANASQRVIEKWAC